MPPETQLHHQRRRKRTSVFCWFKKKKVLKNVISVLDELGRVTTPNTTTQGRRTDNPLHCLCKNHSSTAHHRYRKKQNPWWKTATFPSSDGNIRKIHQKTSSEFQPQVSEDKLQMWAHYIVDLCVHHIKGNIQIEWWAHTNKQTNK